MPDRFTWIPLYKELADLLATWEDRQKELIAACVQMREDGLKVTPLNDMDGEGRRFPVEVMDPFSFFANFNRGIRDEQRLGILDQTRRLLGATEPLPSDFSGIPLVNNQRSWFFSYQKDRGPQDIPTLWEMFRLALTPNPLEDPTFIDCFDRTLALKGVAAGLTMGLFWIRPEAFLNLDAVNREYLGIKLPKDGLSADFYLDTVKKVRSLGKGFPQISYDAWASAQAKKSSPQPHTSSIERDLDTGYWLVGAYWAGTEDSDRTQQFLTEGIWQNGYKDKYLDLVKKMNVGDKIAIKASSTLKRNLPFDAHGKTVSRLVIKARGTVVANRNDGRTVEVEWEPDFTEKEWFFFTYQQTVWQLKTHAEYRFKEYVDRLIDFVWNDVPQDYEWFCKQWFDEPITDQSTTDEGQEDTLPGEPYSVEDIVDSGVFLSEGELRQILDRFRMKKNLVLQGPPGVGKTFVAKRLAYALMREKATNRVESIQFHQSYSYEDFIRGFRPNEDNAGAFGLKDAVFYRFCKKAEKDPDNDYVFIIDEINRGNLSQIFGELLMLIEADKRGEKHAIPMMYQRSDEPNFFVPENVHLLGLMNIADRSLSIVDYALRRRFAFIDLEPQFGNPQYAEWLRDRNMPTDLIELVVQRMSALNQKIEDDELLGANYRIGHSFFCPNADDFSAYDRSWFESIVRTEIAPLLNEYWYDTPDRAANAREALLLP